MAGITKNYVRAPRPSKPALRHYGGLGKRQRFEPLDVEDDVLPYLGAYTSMPERKVAGELQRRKIAFIPQVGYFGGRRGGSVASQVVDFELIGQYAPKVLRVQGEYWHRRPGSMARDDVQAMYLRAVGKEPIDLWENEINLDVRATIADALGLPQ